MEITLYNKTQGTSLLLSQDSFEFVLETVDWGSVRSNSNTTRYINLLGVNVDSTYLQPRNINIVLWLVAQSPERMTEKKTFMNKFINPLQDIECVYKEYSLIIRPDSSIQYDNTDIRLNNQILCRCLIQATAYMPLWGLAQNKIVTSKDIKKLPFWPLVIPEDTGKVFGIIPEGTAYDITNTGDVDVGFIAIFEATGSVENPKLTNNISGKYIEVGVTLAAGDILTVSTVTGNKYAKLQSSGVETDVLKNISLQSSMNTLLVTGKNDFTLTADSGADNIKLGISYSPLWFEIQEAEVY